MLLRLNSAAMLISSVAATPISVAELNRIARQSLEQAIPLLWVAGEISNLVRAASGHVYFSLKDAQAQVRCVMFRSRANLLPWQLQNGQQVEVQALVSIYEARGDFQLGVEAMRRTGLGRLYEAFAKLRARLEQEGLFSAERKRLLPAFPRTIGVVTSLQAAALRDIIAACRRRAPHLPLIIFPTLVQGEGAAVQIANAISAANASALCDVLLVVRGGGSIEDLWSFNEEVVARAIAASNLPIVCGVGHETDSTIADFVADQRAATPTAAAELVTSGWFSAAAEVRQLSEDLQRLITRRIEARMQRIDSLSRRLVHPHRQLEKTAMRAVHFRMRLDFALRSRLSTDIGDLAGLRLRLQRQRPNLALAQASLVASARRLIRIAQTSLVQHRHRIDNIAGALKLLDPGATLSRGYSIVRDAEGALVTDSSRLHAGDAVRLQFVTGGADATITSTN
jgi:exodeoxyribonuclease VII large subunit